MVIPVPATNKRKIQGFIHDESATGQTAYIEPAEIFEINNEIRELEYAENREIIQILIQFTDRLRPHSAELLFAYHALGRIDFLRAKAMLAIEIDGTRPVILAKPQIEWYDARHPLLYLSHRKSLKPVVPLDITINSESHILVISGPNAGGKSVCLKTVGLLQYMLQCGLLIPLRASSEAGIFTHIFIDIGDQQSLEDDLSTYSSHLLNLRALLEFADKDTLFLIDEFGSGTEPQSGGAIAEAVLEKLLLLKASGVVTTHYDNLKLLARKGNGIVNGAMLFDPKNMKPLFRLRVGKPGSSFAFEIAANIGLPRDILTQATNKTGESKVNFDRLLQEIEVERLELSQKERQLKAADNLLAELIDKYRKLYADLESKKKAVLDKAKGDARQILDNSNKIIEKTVRDIRSTQADKETTHQLRRDITAFIKSVEADPRENKEDILHSINTDTPVNAGSIPKPDRPLQIGDPVFITGQDEIGEIAEIKGKEATVAFNSLKLKVLLDRLEFAARPPKPNRSAAREYVYSNVINDLNARLSNFTLTIDIRGKRVEEALGLVSKYIDEAILLNIHEISILHGKGNGVLRQVVRDYLSGVPEVKKYADEQVERGGSGKTIVGFR
jgi:DNA mismatch repair protein MutS2